ncbi:FecCD family ABC transporter permease [Bacillus sp. 2205SS5-2]|uniref:FecCD family ABC transporter permease n=1 Tax=Bacillus sp. 2205SS5-2 TaxID=3109031 RepID=UPI003003CF25
MKKYKAVRMGKKRVSFLLDVKGSIVLIGLSCILLLFTIISMGMGEMKISPLTVLSVFFGGGTEIEVLVVQAFRLPRILIAILVGMSLAVAGGLLQGMIRNPLASPDIIGLTGGASVAVVSFLALFSDENNALTVSIQWLPLSAFVGAALTALLLYMLAWKNGISSLRFVLIGIGISALMQALTTLFMLIGPIYRASQANIWITGTVHGSSWEEVSLFAPVTLILLILSFIMVRHVNVQDLGEEVAIRVGSNVQKQRISLLVLCTALTGVGVSMAGGIGFVGLMAPHIARKMVGSAFGLLLPTAALIGAILVLISDLIGRTLFAPLEIPAGVFTASIGAPYFIYLLVKSKKSA